MRKLFYGFGGLAIVVGSFLATLWAMDRIYGPLCPSGGTELRPPFAKFSEPFGYVKEIGIAGDVAGKPMTSKLLLCEDGYPLGPARSAHVDIAKDGRGRYSHWGNMIMFSTSDNSDPNKNGRVYSIVTP